MRVTLIWENCNDLDLHLIEPSNEEIYYGHRTSAAGAELDIDANGGGCRNHSPVENIAYGDGVTVPTGKYQVKVKFYSKHAD